MVSALTKEEFSKSIRYSVELNPAYFQIVVKVEGLVEADTLLKKLTLKQWGTVRDPMSLRNTENRHILSV